MPLTTPPRIRLPHGCTPKKIALPSTLPIGLLAYYKLDDASGSSVADATGNGNTGTWNGTLGSQWGTGLINGDGVLNGTNNFIDLGHPFLAQLQGASGFSVSLWVNPTSTNGTYILAGTSLPGSSSTGFCILAFGGEIYTEAANGSTSSTPGVPGITSGWNHCVLTFNNTTVTPYLNGTAGTPTALSGGGPVGDPGSAYTVQIGNAHSYAYFTAGSIDEVGFWNRALTPQEIAALYNGGIGIQFPFPGA